MTPLRLAPLALTLSCSLASLLPAGAQTPAASAPAGASFLPIAPRIDLKDGDTFVFLGDSITHQCLYTQYVEDYVYTRYPDRRIHFHNAGVGGDIAQNALDRFDEDVAPYKPRFISILLGMNDGSYRPFDQAIFDRYQAGMTTLLDRIQALGASAIPMTPTMHDARAARMGPRASEPRDTYYNGVLSLYGAWLREMAQQRGLGFVDMYGPLNQITLDQRRTAPDWTMIKDAVHPGATGQVVMAAALIADAFPKTQVCGITISQKDGKWVVAVSNGKVTDSSELEKHAVTIKSNALPWVLPTDAAEGYKLVHAGHRMSNEKFTVRNLSPGSYEVRIDGSPIGKWTEAQLGSGVEIEENAATPQYQQALKVAELNQKRNREFYVKIRGEFAALKGQRNKMNKAAGTPDEATAKADFEKYHAAMAERVKPLLEGARALEDEIYKANQPVPHRYEVVALK
jgi:lysophospholipase L1-like esterase